MKLGIIYFCIAIFIIVSCKTNMNINYNLVENKLKTNEEVKKEEIFRLISKLKKNKKDTLIDKIIQSSISYYYNTSPKECIIFLNKSIKRNLKKKMIKSVALDIQNIGFVYDEKKGNFKKALNQTDKALKIWNKLKDTLNMANMYKYKGLLFGKMHCFESAKKEIKTAIYYYSKMKYKNGIAVSYNNLAHVYKEEKRIDSSYLFFIKSRKIWKEEKDDKRIFKINNNLLNLLKDFKNKIEFDSIYNENKLILSKTSIIKSDSLEFKSISYN